MNLKQLEVFLAVAESGSFSRGAEATFLTQSTVSQHIAALEHEVGVKLLDRTGRGALLTEGGKLLLEHARRVVAGAREIEPAMRRFRGLEEAELRVGGSNIPGDHMIPEVLPLFLARHPGVRLTLLQGDSREILDKVAREEVEIGIIGSRFDDEGFAFTPLGRDEIRLIAGSTHPLAGTGPVGLNILTRQEFIMREQGSGTAQTIAHALAGAGVAPATLAVRASLGSNEAVKHAVASGLGVSFLSEISVRKELGRGELVEIPVDGLKISRTFYLVQREGRELSPAARAFADLMVDQYR
ncbi:LysR family transcriptional regulator [Geobacter hydrogenophilus]|uniref:LysR family transcriptional regulator n=1 Tax=Geobacter hydrogenophilus TaxID=40983 RepID=A0A9W6FXP0_9BACT|nr:selenium metabolism-associated LysR family transcriptional regulator [Geobacter hydrogenophilus]MBT0895125.1 LysR family transcriptional regulator [Geobacter hydrogenophilus]GLI36950.1 LysR family transcriptional regulator [Geobacter hydrogenophilus]